MGSHHQFQDIQGLASQQPASADMVFLGFAGRGVARGSALPAVYHVMGGPEMGCTRTTFWLVADVCANGFKRGRRREQLGVGARVPHSPQTCMLALLQRWERHCAAQASLRRTQNCATPT